jgi:tetratricopeptide (TPR) repeat protein
MSLTTILRAAGTALAPCIVLAAAATAATAAAPAAKQFVFTTKSEEARDYAVRAVHAIESFQFGPSTADLAAKAVAADPDFAFGHYLVATFAQTPEAAKPEADKAVELAKAASDGERRYIEAVLLVRANAPDKALPILRELAAAYPDERMVQMVLGQVLLGSGDMKGAEGAFERAKRLDASTPRVHTFLGNVRLLGDDYKGARSLYEKALGMKVAGTAPFGPYTGLAYTYVYEGDYDRAIKVLERFRDDYVKTGGSQQFPEVFIWNSIARLYLESGRPDIAIENYKKGYATVPGSTLDDTQKQIWLGRLHHGTGRSLSRMGRTDEAWKEAETIKSMIENGGEPGKAFWPSYHYIAGYLKYEAGDMPAAIDHMKQTDLTDAFHMLVLARAYDKSGDRENARKWYQAIVDSKTINIERAISYGEAKKRLKA